MVLMDNLMGALAVSLVGMVVTMLLLGALGTVFYLIGRYETNSSAQRKEDEPYVVAAAYYYLNHCIRRPAKPSEQSDDNL
jgi:flagellar basal body-associated protein FliL